jgi:transcription antitermination protein NusB
VENREMIRKRQKARRLLVQALYQWHMNQDSVPEILAQFMAENNVEKFDEVYFTNLLRGIIQQIQTIDEQVLSGLDRPIEMLNPVELAVLRLSTYEFLYCLDVPFRVVIDEAISLAKAFGAVEGHRYVNGVLHHLAEKLRTDEVHYAKK